MNKLVSRNGLLQASSLRLQLQTARGVRHFASAPSIVQPSFWRSLIPKPLRREKLPPDYAALRIKKPKSKEWNPATFFILIFLLIGSMSIQMIALKKNLENFVRQSDTRIGLLREVLERIQKGEKVDVEQALGTGNPERELEWEDVLREIEREDPTRQRKKQDKKKSASDASTSSKKVEPASQAGESKAPVQIRTSNFY